MRIVLSFLTLSVLFLSKSFGQCEAYFIAIAGENGYYSFDNNSVSADMPNTSFLWEFGDGTISDAALPVHQYEQSGTYEVCLYLAVMDGDIVTCGDFFCTSLTVTVTSDCPDAIFSVAGQDCGIMNFEIGSFVDGEAVTWFPGDETGAVETGHFFSHTYAQPGEYTVCAFYTSPACPAGVELCTTIVVDACTPDVCPTLIVGEAIDCDSYIFSIPNYPVGNVIWNFGDGVTETASTTADHSYSANGVYVITAQYSGPGCPNGTSINYTINVDCVIEETCPTNIEAEQVDCDSYIFHIANTSAGDVSWDFGDGVSENSGVTADHSYSQNGVYVVTAEYHGPNCLEGITLVFTVSIDCNGVDYCPDQIWSGLGANCGVMLFEIANFVAGEDVVWYPGDGTGPIDGGHFLEHTYANGGVYEVCAFYTSPLCPNGVELCTAVTVEDCTGDGCPTDITHETIDCNSFVFTVEGVQSGDVIWSFGDQLGETASITADHSYVDDGVYVISAQYAGPGCPNGILLLDTVTVQCNSQPVCPDQITISPEALCHQYLFSVNNWGNSQFGDITWDFGDNEGYGMNDFLHMYLEPAAYDVCAWGTTDACPEGFEICTTLEVLACGGDTDDDGCPDDIAAWPVNDCGLWHFEAGPGAAGMTVSWNWGDGSLNTDNVTVANHQYDTDGTYVVTLTYYSPECNQTSTIQFTLEANACEENPCEMEIWNGQGEVCGLVLFEVGSFVEGEEFLWYFGDGSSEEGGHFITHQYTAPGTYVVQCVYSNINCPGYQLMTEIVVEDCQTNCTEVILTLDSYVADGGPTSAFWTIFGSDQSTIDQGVAQYSENDPYYDEAICLEDGCYTLQIEGANVGNSDFFDAFLQINGASIIQSIDDSNNNIVFITFGVNADCATECTPSSVLFTSFTQSGSTPSVSYVLTNLTSNDVVTSGMAEFNGDIQTYFSEFCLEDGCYSFMFDSSLPITAGQDLTYQLLVDGTDVLIPANVTYEDDYSMIFEFGVNSDCSIAGCEASFEPIVTNTPGHIEFQNTSNYDGVAEWHWDYGNGVTSDGQGGNVWYESNGVYVVCLTIYTDGCTDTYCETITVSNMESGCEFNEVTISIASEYATKDAFDMIELLFNVNDITIEGLDITAYEGTVTLAGCVPDGCYEITAQAPAGMEITAESISITVDAGEASALLGLNVENNSVTAELAINSDCEDSVYENALSLFNVYPNPANEMLTVRSVDNHKIERLEILDASGRMVISMNQTSQVNVAQLAAGCYFVKVTTAQNAAVVPLNIQH